MKIYSKDGLAAIIMFGLLLTSLSIIETANCSTVTEINSDAPLETAADSPALHEDFTVLKTNSTISEPIFNRTTSEITFNVTGPSGTQGYIWCKLAESLVPYEDVSKEVKVLLDGNQINYMYSFDEGAWQLFFNYTHSTHQVAISLPKENPTIFGIDRLTFVAVFVVICVALGTTIVVLRRKQKPNQQQVQFNTSS
jgi:hypothetical protein